MSASRSAISLVGSVLTFAWKHPANRGQRIRALGRAVRFQIRGRLGKRTIVPLGDKMRIWGILHRPVSSRVAYANPPDLPEMMAWKLLLANGGLFVDVGANLGTYTVWALGSGAERVVAVEPSPEAVALIQENLALNEVESKVEIHTCVLSAETGTAFVTEGLDATNHLVDERSGVLVKAMTLDEVLGNRRAAGVKIDVEGAERLVLDGAPAALADGRIRAFQLEWNPRSEMVLAETRQPIVDILTYHGYSFFRPDDQGILRPTSTNGYGADVFAVLA